MYRIKATIKVPVSRVEGMLNRLQELGIDTVEAESIPYDQFAGESRMDYDCVFPEAWSDGEDVFYLRFYFDDSEEGRAKSYAVEYGLMQIPLNLCYVEV